MKFTVNTNFGTYCGVTVDVQRYQVGKNLCLQMWHDGEPLARLTTNIDHSRKLKPAEGFVDTNNCPWAEEFIQKNGLGHPTGEVGHSGFCTYPIYEFDLDKF